MMQSALELLREIRAEKAASLPAEVVLPAEAAHSYQPVTPTQKTHNTQNRPPTAPENCVPENWNQASADVLGILAGAGQPVLHSQIVKSMAGRGHSKEAAREAIEVCQSRHWIFHNLVSGYELADCTDNREMCGYTTGCKSA